MCRSATRRRVGPPASETHPGGELAVTGRGAAARRMGHRDKEGAMHIQIITFRLKELTPEGYARLCNEQTRCQSDHQCEAV